jgi:3-deoxy-7-phosphoheptulonate synthase
MLVQLKENITTKNENFISDTLLSLGYKYSKVETNESVYLVCVGKKEFDIRKIGSLEGVKDVHRVSDDYKLVSKKWKLYNSKIKIDTNLELGSGIPLIMAGPCSIESEEQILSTIGHLNKNGIKIMRGGVFKPRSSPYAFRGFGIDGLKLMHEHCSASNIKIISEVMQVSQIDEMLPYVDIFQVGARNSQNFNLLDALGSSGKPVMIKRGISGTIDELLYSAEYVFCKGNEKIILCERGIRTFEKAYRNTFDINAISILKQKSHLPVIADPSHGVGIREHVSKLALASLVSGADGLIYEVHENPEKAFSDGQQTLNYFESNELINKIKILSESGILN